MWRDRSDTVDLALSDQLADLHVVEADVVPIRGPTADQPVVVDHRDALRLGLGFDRGAAARVEGIDQQYRCLTR